MANCKKSNCKFFITSPFILFYLDNTINLIENQYTLMQIRIVQIPIISLFPVKKAVQHFCWAASNYLFISSIKHSKLKIPNYLLMD